jgi:hypothetical protein
VLLDPFSTLTLYNFTAFYTVVKSFSRCLDVCHDWRIVMCFWRGSTSKGQPPCTRNLAIQLELAGTSFVAGCPTQYILSKGSAVSRYLEHNSFFSILVIPSGYQDNSPLDNCPPGQLSPRTTAPQTTAPRQLLRKELPLYIRQVRFQGRFFSSTGVFSR